MELNNEKVEIQNKYFMDKMEHEHKKEMTEMENQYKILVNKFETLERSNEAKQRKWFW